MTPYSRNRSISQDGDTNGCFSRTRVGMLADFAHRLAIDILLLEEATTEDLYNIVGNTAILNVGDIGQGTAGYVGQTGHWYNEKNSLAVGSGLRQFMKFRLCHHVRTTWDLS